jgi:hypothetical protein
MRDTYGAEHGTVDIIVTSLAPMCGRWDSSWAVTRLHTEIGLTGYLTRDVRHTRHTLNRRDGKAWLTYVATFHIYAELRRMRIVTKTIATLLASIHAPLRCPNLRKITHHSF